jgi:hypothetical protein
MGTTIDNATKLVFTFDGESLISQFVSDNNVKVMQYQGVTLTPIPTNSFPIQMSTTQNDMETIKQLIAFFVEKLKFANSTIDTVVRETVDYLKRFDTLTDAEKKNANYAITIRKLYAKYFYNVFKNKVFESTNSQHPLEQHARVIVELVSWYFMRRIVLIYIVCACLEKLLQKPEMAPISSASSPTPQQVVYLPSPSQPSLTPTPTPTPLPIPTKTNSAQVVSQGVSSVLPLTNKVNQQILNLDNILQTTPQSASTVELTNSLRSTRTLLDAQKNQNLELQQELHNTKQELASLRKLLLESTSMIFSMDELWQGL